MAEQQNDIFGDDTHGNDLLASELEAVDLHRWPRMLAELVDVYSAAATREGIVQEEEKAQRIARWVVLTLGQHFGGRQFYIPQGGALRIALRDTKIWSEFTGNNVSELAGKYHLSEVQIYKIIKEQRALHRAKVQPQLPLGGTND